MVKENDVIEFLRDHNSGAFIRRNFRRLRNSQIRTSPEDAMDVLRDIVEQSKISQDEEGVSVKPSVVVEVTNREIQETEEYTSGYALRVPKVVRFRLNKKVEEIDNVGKLHKLYELQYGEASIPKPIVVL